MTKYNPGKNQVDNGSELMLIPAAAVLLSAVSCPVVNAADYSVTNVSVEDNSSSYVCTGLDMDGASEAESRVKYVCETIDSKNSLTVGGPIVAIAEYDTFSNQLGIVKVDHRRDGTFDTVFYTANLEDAKNLVEDFSGTLTRRGQANIPGMDGIFGAAVSNYLAEKDQRVNDLYEIADSSFMQDSEIFVENDSYGISRDVADGKTFKLPSFLIRDGRAVDEIVAYSEGLDIILDGYAEADEDVEDLLKYRTFKDIMVFGDTKECVLDYVDTVPSKKAKASEEINVDWLLDAYFGPAISDASVKSKDSFAAVDVSLSL